VLEYKNIHGPSYQFKLLAKILIEHNELMMLIKKKEEELWRTENIK